MRKKNIPSEVEQAVKILNQLAENVSRLSDQELDLFMPEMQRLKNALEDEDSFRQDIDVFMQAEQESSGIGAEIDRGNAASALAEELDAMKQLHRVSTHFTENDDLTSLLEVILHAAIQITGADMANFQLLDPEKRTLKIAAHQGFEQSFLEYFREVDENDPTSCATALKQGNRVIVEDVEKSSIFAGTPALVAMQEAQALAVVSTPVFTRSGKFFGMLNTHWRSPHMAEQRTLHHIDMLARQAADFIERQQAEQALRKSERRFRNSIDTLIEGFLLLSAVREPENGENPGKITDLRFAYVNEEACRLFQFAREEAIGRTLLDLLPGEEESGMFEKYLEVIETGQPLVEQVIRYDHNLTLTDGENQRIFDWRAVKFNDGVIVTWDDITQQVLLKAEHQEGLNQKIVNRRLAEQREVERQKFAQDVHDGPVQTLSSILFRIRLLTEEYTEPALKLEFDQIAQSVKEAIQVMRHEITELRPPSLITFGLAKSIQHHLEYLRASNPQIEWSLNLTNHDEWLPETMLLALFRIYQEAVNNILRHSEATKAHILYRLLSDKVVLEIEDNGVGFSEAPDLERFTSEQHYGVAGIAERVEAIGGVLDLSSKPGEGTLLRVEAPIPDK